MNPEADSRPPTVSGVPIVLCETLGDGVKKGAVMELVTEPPEPPRTSDTPPVNA